MTGPGLTDPAALFRDMLGQWEQMANEFGANMLKSGEFTRVMHGANAATMKVREASGEMMERARGAANMPSKADVADLSARLTRIEAVLGRMEAMLAAQSGSTAEPAAARVKPPRTRTPPPKPAPKAAG